MKNTLLVGAPMLAVAQLAFAAGDPVAGEAVLKKCAAVG